MAPERLDPARTAVIVFDMLNGYLKTPEAAAQADRIGPFVANAVKLVEAARATGTLVAYAMGSHRQDGATTAILRTDTDNRLRPWSADHRPGTRLPVAGGTWEGQVIPELAPRPEDYLVPKYRWSAFFSTYLDTALRVRHIDTVILCGGSTDIGIASTAFAARDLDYHIVVASDACSSAETDSHDQFMRRIFPRMSRVRTTAQVVAMLTAGPERSAAGPGDRA